VQCAGIVLGEDGDGPDPALGGGPGDPDRDLAAVGDQEPVQDGTFIAPSFRA
jgi:hypothetical protein